MVQPYLTRMFEPEIECMAEMTPQGMAHWATSGPQGTHCVECKHFDLSSPKQENGRCLKYTTLTRRKGEQVPKWTPACKHFSWNKAP